MQRFQIKSYVLFMCVSLSSLAFASTPKCIENICIGDDLEKLTISWKTVPVTYSDERIIQQELKDRDISEVLYDYNEQIIAEQDVLKRLLPYIIGSQRFDEKVLLELSRVRAICSSLTMTGEVENESNTRLFVTFRVVADQGGRGKLRIVGLEKLFNIVPAHIRPSDAKIYKSLKKELKTQYPDLAVVRDVDGREISSSADNATAILGFRFVSSVTNPLVFKLIDDAEVKFIEEDDSASPLCKSS